MINFTPDRHARHSVVRGLEFRVKISENSPRDRSEAVSVASVTRPKLTLFNASVQIKHSRCINHFTSVQIKHS